MIRHCIPFILVTALSLLGPAHAQGIRVVGSDLVRPYVEHAQRVAPALQAQVYEQLSLTPKGLTVIKVSPDAVQMQALAKMDNDGSMPPDWAAGLAYPAKRLIYLHASTPISEFEETLHHELSHIAFGQVGKQTRAPRWFTEGLAVWQSEGFDLRRSWLLTEAAAMDSLYPLQDLDRGFPTNGARAGVAYAQAVHFVGFVRTEYGAEKFGRFVQLLGVGDLSFGESVETAFGLPLWELEREWRGRIQSRWGWVGLLFGESTLWVFAALLLVIGWYRRRRQAAARLRQMKLEEQALMGDPEPHSPVDGNYVEPYDGRTPTIH